MTIERPMFPPVGSIRRTAEKSCVSDCMLATKRADHFLELEAPMRNLRAMVEIVQIILNSPYSHVELSSGVEHETLMTVVTDHLELMVEGLVDDYCQKLEATAVQS